MSAQADGAMIATEAISLVNCCLPPPVRMTCGAPQASLYLAAALSRAGREVSVYDTAMDFRPETFTADALYDYLSAIPSRVLGLSLWDSVLPRALAATRRLKEEQPDRVLILGGPSASALGANIMRLFPWVDCLVVGEGETSLPLLLSFVESGNLSLDLLPETVFIRSNGQIAQGAGKAVRLLSEQIPLPDYSKIDRGRYKRLEVVTSRGCPRRCSYCSVNVATGELMRQRPLSDLFDEIAGLIGGDEDCIHILDDNFTIDRPRLHTFCEGFRDRFPRNSWSCYARLGDLDPATTDLMTTSRCCGIYTGVESVDRATLTSVGKATPAVDPYLQINEIAKSMNVTASFIWGLPEETMDALHSTLHFIDKLLDIEHVFVNLFQISPLSGTRLTHSMRDRLAFNEDCISGFVFPPFYAPLSEEEISLIRQYPIIFSAFYHDPSDLFLKKQSTIRTFLGN